MENLDEVVNWPDIGESQRRLDISQTSMYSWVWGGKVEARQVCGRWRVNPVDIERIRREREMKRLERDRRKQEARNGN